jgi:hypothetical protein
VGSEQVAALRQQLEAQGAAVKEAKAAAAAAKEDKELAAASKAAVDGLLKLKEELKAAEEAWVAPAACWGLLELPVPARARLACWPAARLPGRCRGWAACCLRRGHGDGAVRVCMLHSALWRTGSWALITDLCVSWAPTTRRPHDCHVNNL